MTLTRLKSILLAVLIVSSVILASPGVGAVAALHDCSTKDAAVYGFSFGYINEDKCAENHVEQAVEEVRTAETNQDKVDIYVAALGQKDNSEDYHAVYGNYVNDSENVAWMKAEAAVAEAYKNGATKSQAKARAKEAIEEYYAVKQINLIEAAATHGEAMHYMVNRSHHQEGFEQFLLTARDHPDYYLGSSGSTSTGLDKSYTLELVNATTYETTAWHPQWGYGASERWQVDQKYVTFSNGPADATGIIVEAPNSNYEDKIAVNFTEYHFQWQRLKQSNRELQSESDVFVDAIWQDLEDGNLDPNKIESRTTKMFEYGTKAQQNDSGFNDVIAANAAMGLETPNLNGTGQMTVETGSGNTYDGLLSARDVPGGAWQTGQTYDPANFDGPVYLSTVDGEQKRLTRPFTVRGAVDRDGNEQSTVETKRYNYQTTNSSRLSSQMEDLLTLQQDYQQRSESVDSNGGGGSSGGGTLPDWLTQSFFGIPVWVLAGLLVLVLVIFGGGS